MCVDVIINLNVFCVNLNVSNLKVFCINLNVSNLYKMFRYTIHEDINVQPERVRANYSLPKPQKKSKKYPLNLSAQ